jgi:peptidyl-prolyl cis-trans isomerase C
MDRTSFKKSDQAGSKVVAEIGAEKITEADLDAVIESNIDNQLSAVSAFMTDEQLKEQKKKVLEQYKSPSVRQQFLQQWVAQEVLYRQAQQEQLAEKPEVKKLMEELCRGVLSQYMMNQQLAAKIKLTETDLQAYYTANKDKFIEPAKAKISHILVNDEKQAADLISRARGGEKFDGLAKEFSKDKDTKEAGGRIEGDVTKGDSYVPVVGDVNGLSEKIFAADANSVLDKPIKAEKGWEIVKVDEKTAERQKDFDEVRQQVMSMLLSQKRQDVRQDYIKQLMEQYNVVIHTSVFSDKKEDKTEDKAAGAVK